jgi:hypothetical protein
MAAKHGHLEALKYAHKNGCKWSATIWEYARCDKVKKYLKDNNCPK